MVEIRNATERDRSDIRALHEAAFGAEEGAAIAGLVEDLGVDPTATPLLSLVAESDGRVTGHVLFTAVRVPEAGRFVRASILAPLAVLPEAQKTGVGGQLVGAGLERLGRAGVEMVFVLGDPAYYGRFEFEPATRLGLRAPHPIPEEHADAWRVRFLGDERDPAVTGTVACAEALNDPAHW